MLATARHFGQETLGIGRDDIVFSAGKLFFAYGLANSMAFPMSVGATTILVPDPVNPAEGDRDDASVSADGIFRRTGALCSAADAEGYRSGRRLRPTAPLCLRRRHSARQASASSWRSIIGVDIVEGAGATEILTFFSNRPDDIRYGTPGKPLPGYDAKILDADGNELGVGEVGELVVRGPTSRRRLLESARRGASALSSVNGFTPATCTCATQKDFAISAGATTTCSKLAAYGFRRWSWSWRSCP